MTQSCVREVVAPDKEVIAKGVAAPRAAAHEQADDAPLCKRGDGRVRAIAAEELLGWWSLPCGNAVRRFSLGHVER